MKLTFLQTGGRHPAVIVHGRPPEIAKRPTAQMIAEGLSVPERVLLFCIASVTDWQKAGVKSVTVQQMMIRGLSDREAAGSYVLTDQGRAVPEALMMRAATRGWRRPPGVTPALLPEREGADQP